MEKIKVVLFKSKKLSGGRFPVMVCLDIGTRKYYGTGVCVQEHQWKKNGDFGAIINHPQATYLNNKVNDKFLEVANSVKDGEIPGAIKAIVDGVDFYVFGERIAVEFDNQDKFSQATCYRAMLKSLQDCIGPLNTKSVTIDVVEKYRGHLTQKLKSKNTIRNYTGLIKSLVSKAIARRIIRQADNHLIGYEIGDPIKGFKSHLEDKEIQALHKIKLEVNALWYARATFFIQYYLQGMRVGDVIQLKKEDVVDNRVLYRMKKNDKKNSVQIPTQLKPIIDKLLNGDGSYLLPYLNGYELKTKKEVHGRIRDCRGQINKHLGELAKTAEIKKHITTHVGRHSFASKVYGQTKDMRLIQKLLNHGRIETTEVYMEDLKDNPMDIIVQGIFNKKS